jgi:hypothetical protein
LGKPNSGKSAPVFVYLDGKSIDTFEPASLSSSRCPEMCHRRRNERPAPTWALKTVLHAVFSNRDAVVLHAGFTRFLAHGMA